MVDRSQIRTYAAAECVSFRSTKAKFGGLSNMAGGFPLHVNGILVPSAEALYQACRFPHKPDIQQHIIEQKSPMTAKMVSKPHRGETRPDWMRIRVRVMRWVLRVKLAMHWPEFSGLLLETDDRPIVEDSRRDDFWGALKQDDGTLVGMNVLGRLLMELREELKGPGKEALRVVAPPSIPDFLLLEQPIGQMGFGTKAAGVVADPDVVAKPGTLWGSQIEGPEDELDEEPAAAASGVASEEQLAKKESADRTMRYPKRLIEVDLPIKRISAHARREKSIRHGHICTLHIWWARRPLAACRAVICAALWPDPADPLCPQAFRDKAGQEMKKLAAHFAATKTGLEELAADLQNNLKGPSAAKRKAAEDDARQRCDEWQAFHKLKRWDDLATRKALLSFIAWGAGWEQSTMPTFLEAARRLTQAAHEALGGAPGTRPLVVDPFAGGGSIPLEALRVGADAFASDLNPVAVLLNKVVLEYIPKYGQRLADEVRKWGQWVKEQAEKELGEFYPKGPNGSVPIAYLWARTIKCEGPGCGADVPLLRSPWLLRKGKSSYALQLTPDKRAGRVDIEVLNNPKGANVAEGTVKRGVPTCPLCGYSTPLQAVKRQFRERHGGTADARLLAVVADTAGTRLFRTPSDQDIRAATACATKLASKKRSHDGALSFIPDEDTTHYHTFVNRASVYGLQTWEDFYSIRQRLALGCFAEIVRRAPIGAGSDIELATRTLLAFSLDRCADYWSSLATWGGQFIAHTFGRQALPFVWDYAEANPFSDSTGNWSGAIEWIARVVEQEASAGSRAGQAIQSDATAHPLPDDSVSAIVTDPPYYYAIQYADLSDYFYVWLKRTLREQHPELFANAETPKAQEAVVQSPGDEYSDDPKNRAHYELVMTKALGRARELCVASGIGVVVFANATTDGWEALLDSLISTGWIVTGSWPIDTERPGRVISSGRSVLASSVHLACRPRENPDGSVRADDVGDWREVLSELPSRIHEWMPRLADEGVVGADAIFACLGPALEVFSRYSRVEKASGKQVPLREYLENVWAAVAQEALNMIFTGADATGFEEDARLTAMWLWTLKTGNGEPASAKASAGKREPADNGDEDESESGKGKKALRGYVLEYDAARKIAQGLGAHLENLAGVVAVEGETARLLSVADRTAHLFGKDEAQAPAGRRKKDRQMKLGFEEEVERAEAEGGWGAKGAPKVGETTLDRVHQAMILFASGRSEALKRFLVEEGVGRDGRFWTLAQALLALYPSGSDERRWVDGVLARKKGLGF